MPRFDLHFAAEAQIANEIVQAGETSRILGPGWTLTRIEFLYELAYLRVFAAWESTLESIFLRSLCGYASSAGQEMLVTGTYYRTIAAAEAGVLGGHSYMLWHSSTTIINRCRGRIRSGVPPAGSPPFPALQETAIASHQARLDAFAAIRHRIVHAHQSDAKSKFDNATVTLAAKTYPSSKPGKFLKDIDHNAAPPRKWLDTVIAELTGLAAQMV